MFAALDAFWLAVMVTAQLSFVVLIGSKSSTLQSWGGISFYNEVVINTIARSRADGKSNVIASLRREVMTVRLIGINTHEVLKHLVTEVILLVNVLFQHVFQPLFQRKRPWEVEHWLWLTVFLQNGDHEYTLSVLRNTELFGV